MPFDSSIIPLLSGSQFHIQPEHGWGWKTCSANGQREIDSIPVQSIRIQFSELVVADGGPVGLRGEAIQSSATFGYQQVLCLLHTCEWVTQEELAIPVSIHCSHQSLELCSKPLAPTGIAPVWGTCEGVIGFGILVIE